MQSNLISPERKNVLLEVIRQQENNWASDYSDFVTGPLNAQRELNCGEALSVCYMGRTYSLENPVIKVCSGRGADSRIYICLDEITDALLSDVVAESDITEDADSAICLGLSFLGNELSLKMIDSVKSGPSSDPFMNMLFNFMK